MVNGFLGTIKVGIAPDIRSMIGPAKKQLPPGGELALSLDDPRGHIEVWQADYNEHWPHQLLAERTPKALAQEYQHAGFL
jgi:hypothetical protein